MFKKLEVYECPNGVFETDLDRAKARFLIQLVENLSSPESLSFSAAFTLVKARSQVMGILQGEVD